MKTIEYYRETKEYFKKFLNPLGDIDNSNLLKYYDRYEDNIKLFVEKELNWDITIYYTKIINSKPNYIEWFYIIENGMELYSSDEYESNKLISYEFALNKAIQCVFNNIYNINI